jgi:hypothetical protein
MSATDPANLQPKVRPVLKAAADHLRMYPPAGADDAALGRLIESLEAPWGARIERQVTCGVLRRQDRNVCRGSREGTRVVRRPSMRGLSRVGMRRAVAAGEWETARASRSCPARPAGTNAFTDAWCGPGQKPYSGIHS